MTDKTQKIREEIEIVINRRLNLLNGDYFDLNKEADGFTNEIMDIIDSLQEEPVSEDLEEKAAQLSQKYFPNEENIWARPNIEAQDCKNACIEMAKWQKEKMMAKAIDGKVLANGMGNPILHLWDKGRHLVDKKVKVIIIKED